MALVYYLELIAYKVYADLRAETSRTYFSLLWWIIEPALFMAGFYVVFAILLERRTADFAVFLLVGLTVWKWFASSIAHASGSILGNQGLMQQVYLPKIVFPVVVVLTDAVKFAVAFLVLLALLGFHGGVFGPAWLALPALLLIQLLLIGGFSCLAAALVPLVPDIRFLIDNVMFLMMFLSGIFFSREDIPANLQTLFYLNPMASLIEAYRGVLLANAWPSPSEMAAIAVAGAALLALAALVTHRLDRVYPRLTVQ